MPKVDENPEDKKTDVVEEAPEDEDEEEDEEEDDKEASVGKKDQGKQTAENRGRKEIESGRNQGRQPSGIKRHIKMLIKH